MSDTDRAFQKLVPPHVLQRSAISISNVVKQGWLLQASTGSQRSYKKSFKKRWFILDSEYFYAFSDDAASKPLKVYVLMNYKACESTESQQKFSFKVTPLSSSLRGMALCGTNATERDEWINSLNKAILSSRDISGKYGEGKYRVETSLQLTISDARFNDNLARDTYCTVMLDGIQKARTATSFGSSKPLYSQEYEFIDLENPEQLVVQVKETKKRQDITLGQVIVPVDEAIDQRELLKYPLLSVQSNMDISGGLRLSIVKTAPKKFRITIASAKNLIALDSTGTTSDPYVYVTHGEKKFKTPPIKKTLNPVWKNQTFVVEMDENLPILFEVLDIDSKLRNPFMGQVSFTYQNMEENATGIEKEHHLSNKMENPVQLGFILLGVQKRVATILTDKAYEPLFQCLVDTPSVILKLATVSNSREKAVAEALVKSFDVKNTAVYFIKNITKWEISNTKSDSVLFRANTVCTKSVDTFLQLHGSAYLHYLLKTEVEKLVHDTKHSCELDPARLSEKDQASAAIVCKRNLKTLYSYLDSLMHTICGSLNRCPATFRSVFKWIQDSTIEKFPNSATVRYTSATGFIFLRFICPALLTPKAFGLVEEDPKPKVARDLMLIAKTLQNLANMVSFGNKEEFMIPANEWLSKNTDAMKAYVDALCSLPTGAIDELCTKRTTNWGREMSHLTFHLQESRPRVLNYFGTDSEDFKQLEVHLEKLNEIQEQIDLIENPFGLNSPKLPGYSTDPDLSSSDAIADDTTPETKEPLKPMEAELDPLARLEAAIDTIPVERIPINRFSKRSVSVGSKLSRSAPSIKPLPVTKKRASADSAQTKRLELPPLQSKPSDASLNFLTSPNSPTQTLPTKIEPLPTLPTPTSSPIFIQTLPSTPKSPQILPRTRSPLTTSPPNTSPSHTPSEPRFPLPSHRTLSKPLPPLDLKNSSPQSTSPQSTSPQSTSPQSISPLSLSHSAPLCSPTSKPLPSPCITSPSSRSFNPTATSIPSIPKPAQSRAVSTLPTRTTSSPNLPRHRINQLDSNPQFATAPRPLRGDFPPPLSNRMAPDSFAVPTSKPLPSFGLARSNTVSMQAPPMNESTSCPPQPLLRSRSVSTNPTLLRTISHDKPTPPGMEKAATKPVPQSGPRLICVDCQDHIGAPFTHCIQFGSKTFHTFHFKCRKCSAMQSTSGFLFLSEDGFPLCYYCKT